MSTTSDHQTTPPAGEPAATPSSWRLIEMVHCVWVTQVVVAVARLEIIDQLDDRPRTVGDLAVRTSTHPDSLHRLLRAAAALGLVAETTAGEFTSAPLGEHLRTGPGSLRDFALFHSAPGMLRPYERLSEAVRTGAPVASAALGQDLWDYYRDHPDEGALFAGAMSGVSDTLTTEVTAALDLSGCRRIVDVGGGQGTLLTALLDSAPTAAGVLFDLPEVIGGARPALRGSGPGDRIELVAGDCFAAVPADGDVYVLSHVLHDWDDEPAGRILRNCHRAAAPDAVLVAVEMVLPAETRSGPWVPYMLDLAMLVSFGGRERNRAQFADLLTAAGWELTAVAAQPSGQSVLTARRR